MSQPEAFRSTQGTLWYASRTPESNSSVPPLQLTGDPYTGWR